jgi:hypothetical protein
MHQMSEPVCDLSYVVGAGTIQRIFFLVRPSTSLPEIFLNDSTGSITINSFQHKRIKKYHALESTTTFTNETGVTAFCSQVISELNLETEFPLFRTNRTRFTCSRRSQTFAFLQQ